MIQLAGLLLAMCGAYWLGRARGSRRRPYWSAPPTAGHIVEVFEEDGRTLWQRARAPETAASIAESWCFPGYAVLRYGPGDNVKEVVCGDDLLEEWNAVWGPQDPEGFRRAR